MKKGKYIFLSIITLGIFYFCTKSKAKKKAGNTNTSLSVSKMTGIDVNAFLKDIGGKENIISCESTISTLKITFKDVKKVLDVEKLKKTYKIVGCIKSYNKITFLFGDNSQAIEREINSK